MRFELWNGSGDDVIDQLQQGLADLAVIAAPFDAERLNSIHVGSEPWVALISKDNPLAALPGDTLPLRMLDGQELIVPRRKSRVEAIRQWFAGEGITPQILCEQSNYLDALALTRANAGVSIFPQTMENHDSAIVVKPISEPSRQAEYYLVWDKRRRLSSPAEAFLDFVSDCLAEDSKK